MFSFAWFIVSKLQMMMPLFRFPKEKRVSNLPNGLTQYHNLYFGIPFEGGFRVDVF
jgi:hypothetical protein